MLSIKEKITLSLTLFCTASLQAKANNIPTSNLVFSGIQHPAIWGSLLFPFDKKNNATMLAGMQLARTGLTQDSYSETISVGLGKREKKKLTYGGYLFVDYIDSENGNELPHPGGNAEHNSGVRFYRLSPGFDVASNNGAKRFAFNYYLPVGNKSRGTTMFADQAGIDNSLIFDNHTVTGQPADLKEYTMYGFDAKYTLNPKNNDTSYTLGVYQFGKNPLMSKYHITGLTAGISYQVDNHMKLNLDDRFDNVYSNRIVASLNFSLDGYKHTNPLTSQIYRNLDFLNTKAGTASRQLINQTGDRKVEYRNIYFVKSGAATGGDGSYDHPFSNIGDINNLPSNANLWFAGSSTYHSTEAFQLSGHQSIFGRSGSFQLPTYGGNSSAPVLSIDNGILISDGIHQIDGINLQGAGVANSRGINISNATLSISNSKIGGTTVATSYKAGIYAHDNATVNVSNTTIDTTDDSSGGGSLSALEATYGIIANNNSHLNINNTNINVENNGSDSAYGIILDVLENAPANHSTAVINGGSIATLNTSTGQSTALLSDRNSRITASNVDMSSEANGSGTAYGVRSQADSTINITGGSLSALNTSTSTGNSSALYSLNDSTITASNVDISSEASGSSSATGAFSRNNSTINITGGSLSALNTSTGASTALYSLNDSTITASNVDMSSEINGSSNAFGAYSSDDSAINITGGSLSALNTSTSTAGWSLALYSLGNSRIMARNVDVSSEANGSGSAVGAASWDHSAINITGGSLSALNPSMGGQSIALNSNGTSTITVDNTRISSTAETDSNATIKTGTGITIDADSKCYLNGQEVLC